jgi:tetratricopeptide (TPR) repeat protein
MQEERWAELVKRLGPLSNRSAEQEYEYGIALAHLQHWDQARSALLRGSRLQPGDKRFPIELAGIAFKLKHNGRAISYLHRALRLDPTDDYANEFLATLYFLQGNLEAAVKYWNRISTPKPKIAAQPNEPFLRVRPALLDHAIAFSSGEAMQLTQLRSTDARLQNLEIFPSYRMDLVARSDGGFDSVLRAQELNGFGNSKAEVLLRTFRGLPFQEITPEYDNVRGSATNLIAVARWDPDKRRYAVKFQALWDRTRNGATTFVSISAMKTGRYATASRDRRLCWPR